MRLTVDEMQNLSRRDQRRYMAYLEVELKSLIEEVERRKAELTPLEWYQFQRSFLVAQTVHTRIMIVLMDSEADRVFFQLELRTHQKAMVNLRRVLYVGQPLGTA